MSDQNKSSMKIQIAILAIFVVFMPLGSWYYLQSGHNYNKELMAELKDYGKVPSFELVNQNNDTIKNEDLEGKFFVVDFYNQGSASAKTTMDYARRILGQFETQNDFFFISHCLDPLNQNARKLKRFAESEDLAIQRAHFFSGSKQDLLRLLSIGYKVPILDQRKDDGSIPLKSNISQLPEEYPYLVLVDDNMTIRNYYNVNDEDSVKRLVEHLALILPREKKGKAELKREKEK